MPYFRESKEKDTHAKESKQDNDSQEYQLASQGGAVAPPPDVGLSTGSGYERLFAFIREAHLEEAQEFRLKGYNSQVPEVDGGLLTQLRDDLAAAKSRLCLQVSVGGPLGSLWLLDQIGNIERLTSTLSDDVIKHWIEQELIRKNTAEAAGSELGSRRTAQSLARRLESTLQTLIRVVHTLRAMDDYSTPEKRHDMLVAEITGVFSSYDKSTVIQALGSMTAEASGNAAWASLMQARKAAWEAGKSSSVNAMIAASRHEAEKANKKARQLQGDPQTFFSHVAAYLQSLSSDLAKVSIHAGLSTIPPTLQHDEVVASLSRSNSLSQRIKTDFDKKKLQAQTAVAGMKVHAHRLVRIAQHGHPTGTPTKAFEHVVTDSIIRSILWQWQQPAIKIQYASAALLSKVDELKKIEGILASYSTTDGRESEQEGRNTPDSPSGEEDLIAQVREWVSDSLEQEKNENQQAAKVVTLERLLSGDIASARDLVKRLGKTKESVQNMLRRQRFAVLKMIVEHLPAAAPSLKAVDKLLPDVARNLTESIDALDKALQAAEYPTRDLSEAKKQAGHAQLMATKVKESLSADSARLTERPLDEHSRGARLAKHWANLSKKQNVDNYTQPDAQQVLASLKGQGLLVGTLSTGDPAGYLFATRLAGELENTRNDELRLPMSPEQYAALEKGLVEYIVKWGQKRISRGVTRIVIELSFEQALNAVSFNVSSLFRLPYKVLKASIKIPYNVNKVNHYTMPGHDKPYKAIYGMLGKKLKQLGFNLLTAPVPGVIKLVAGAGISTGAALHNLNIDSREKTFSAVYQHVAEGKPSEKIKMDSVKGLLFDSALNSATMTVFGGVRWGLQSKESKNNGAASKYESKENVLSFLSNPQGVYSNLSSESRELTSEQSLFRDRREVKNNDAHSDAVANHKDKTPYSESDSDIDKSQKTPEVVLTDDAINSKQTSLKEGVDYNHLSDHEKKDAYISAIHYILYKIENDRNLSVNIRRKAYLARAMGAQVLVPVDINGYKLNNKLFLPVSPGAKTGVLINLDSEVPYYYINKGADLIADTKYSMPYDSDFTIMPAHAFISVGLNGMEALHELRSGKASLDEYFNINNPEPSDISSLASLLASTIKDDYDIRGVEVTNKRLISRAALRAQVHDSLALELERSQKFPGKLIYGEHSGGYFDNNDLLYNGIPMSRRELIYLFAIKYILVKIERDESLPQNIRKNASLASAGAPIVIPVDIGRYRLNNAFFLPESTDSKSGLLVHVGFDNPYYYVSKGSDLQEDIELAMPYHANAPTNPGFPSVNGMTLLKQVRSGISDFEKEFNSIRSEPMSIKSLSSFLVSTLHEDTMKSFEVQKQKTLMARAALWFYNNYNVRSGASQKISEQLYDNFSDARKVKTYFQAITCILLNIENDERLSKNIRRRAYLARTGKLILVPVDIRGYNVNNTVFLPDGPDSKSGVLIRLDSEIPYYYVSEGGDLLSDIKLDMAFGSDFENSELNLVINGSGNEKAINLPSDSAIDKLNKMIAGHESFERNFNYNVPNPMTIINIAAYLANSIEKDYKLKGLPITNNRLIYRSYLGAQFLDLDLFEKEDEYYAESSADGPTLAGALRAVANPIKNVSIAVQAAISSEKQHTIEETELYTKRAGDVGAWIDATASTVALLTSYGPAVVSTQTSAEVSADVIEGKKPDPLAVTGLVLGGVPSSKLSSMASKINKISGRVVKHGLGIANKSIELAVVERSIKYAVETEEPLAIYQALLASGISAKDSYSMAKNISVELKLNKRIEDSALLNELEAMSNNAPEYSLSLEMPVRSFRVGLKHLLGRINKGYIEISWDGGAHWAEGNKLHLLAYRLQNAGGGRQLPDVAKNIDPNAPQPTTSQSEMESSASEPRTSQPERELDTPEPGTSQATSTQLMIESVPISINENVSNDPIARRKTTDPNLSYRLGGRKAKSSIEGRNTLIVEEDLSEEIKGIVAFGKADAEETGQGAILELYNRIGTELSKTYQRFLSLHEILNEPLRHDEVINQLKIILSVDTRSAEKYLSQFKVVLSRAMEQCKTIKDNDMDTVWITSGSKFNALTYYHDPLKRVFVDVDHTPSFSITIPHEFSHLGNDTKDYFYHTDAFKPIPKVRADAESAIVGGRLDSDELVDMYWSAVQEDAELMRNLEDALNVERGTLQSTDDFSSYYNASDLSTRINVRKLIVEALIYDDSETYVDLISDNADTFSHVFLNLVGHFVEPIDGGGGSKGAMSLISGLAQGSMKK
ncbi:hypothetical protein JFQ86_16365 [Serratia ureilytica]|uniref:hypothetical protein n=1 Tax=Serratia ureilytica TaxID=300181 RepID=UPI0018E71E9C|nr:hypothetical protein [Serratia ureilytica]MBJ2114404.1 hypothetical protein [Serratia ureilytica]